MSSSRPLPSSFDGDEDFYNENRLEKLKRRIIEEPLIPIGCALTCWALLRATRSLRAGNKAQTNRYFRWRIYAQGFTVLAMIGGSYYWQSDREKRKHEEAWVKEKKAQEKRQAWIRELEMRDAEDKAFKARARELQEKKRQKDALRTVTTDNTGRTTTPPVIVVPDTVD